MVWAAGLPEVRVITSSFRRACGGSWRIGGCANTRRPRPGGPWTWREVPRMPQYRSIRTLLPRVTGRRLARLGTAGARPSGLPRGAQPELAKHASLPV